MAIVIRLLELLSASKKLKDSRPYVLRALSSLAVMALLGTFATVMTALAVAGVLGFLYAGLTHAGVDTLVAFLIIAALASSAIGLAVVIARRAWSSVRADVEFVLRAQTPVVGQVADRVNDVAGAFLSGLRSRRRKS